MSTDGQLFPESDPTPPAGPRPKPVINGAFAKTPQKVLFCQGLSDRAVRVYAYLSFRSFGGDRTVAATRLQMARELHFGRKSFTLALEELLKVGLVQESDAGLHLVPLDRVALPEERQPRPKKAAPPCVDSTQKCVDTTHAECVDSTHVVGRNDSPDESKRPTEWVASTHPSLRCRNEDVAEAADAAAAAGAGAAEGGGTAGADHEAYVTLVVQRTGLIREQAELVLSDVTPTPDVAKAVLDAYADACRRRRHKPDWNPVGFLRGGFRNPKALGCVHDHVRGWWFPTAEAAAARRAEAEKAERQRREAEERVEAQAKEQATQAWRESMQRFWAAATTDERAAVLDELRRRSQFYRDRLLSGKVGPHTEELPSVILVGLGEILDRQTARGPDS